MSITDVIFDEDLHRPLHIKDAEAMVARLQKSIEAAKLKRDAEIVPGGLYLDQNGVAYLAVDRVRYAGTGVQLWRLDPRGATHALPAYWRRAEGVEFTPVRVASGRVLMADGTQAPR